MALLTPIGSKFYLEYSSALTEVGEVVSITGPAPSVEALDTTDLTSSTATRIAGRTDWGNVSITFNVNEADDSTLNISELDSIGGTDLTWKITIPCADCSGADLTISGSGICGQPSITITSGSVVQGTIDVQISGDVTVAA